MNVIELLNDLSAKGVELWVEETRGTEMPQLRFRGRSEALTPDLIDNLRKHKPQLTSWLQERQADSDEATTYQPLSNGQMGLWMDWKVSANDSHNHIVTEGLLRKGVNLDALHVAFQQLLDQNPVLRSTYPLRGEQPTLETKAMQQVDFRIIKGIAPESTLHTESQDQPFDLETGPPIRVRIFEETTQQISRLLLVWVTHHIATDYFTQRNLIEQVNENYAKLAEDPGEKPSSTSPQETLNFRDFVRWEQDTLEEDRPRLHEFWSNYLGLSVSPLNFKDWGSTIAQLKSHEEREPDTRLTRRSLSPELLPALRSTAKNHLVTMHTLLLTAFESLVARYHQNRPFLIVYPTMTRRLPGFQNTIGYLVNSVLYRSDHDSQTSFTEALGRTNDQLRVLRENDLYPYEDMLRIARHQDSVTNLVQSVIGFSYFSGPPSSEAGENGPFESLQTAQNGTAQPLTLSVFNETDAIHLEASYHANTIDQPTVERFLGHFEILLNEIIRSPDAPLCSLRLLSESEIATIKEGNNTVRSRPTKQTVVDLFEAHVRAQPQQIAIHYEGDELTYDSLNNRSNQVAQELIRTGVGPDTIVGLYSERSFEMIIGLWGILKAGGAYLPLDPSLPSRRIQTMLKDAKVQHLLIQDTLVSDSNLSADSTLRLEKPTPETGNNIPNPSRRLNQSDLAYVIYTSGSTGHPKGVSIEHRSLLNHQLWMQKTFPLQPGETILQSTPFGFDVSVWEIFAPLCLGGTLLLAAPGGNKDPEYLLDTIIQNRLRAIQLVPAQLQALMEHPRFDQNTLKWIFCGGEALSPRLHEAYQARGLNAELYNMYGPTETCIDATFNFCRSIETPISIGHPIANAEVYILDHNLQPLPEGIPGELCIAGLGLAREYLNRPDATAQAFPVINLFGQTKRLYRTGDRARRQTDGSIEFLGRFDHQIKLRGFRIELGEIEAAITNHTQVRDAIVIVHDQGDNAQLCACLVLNDHSSTPSPDPTIKSVWSDLRSRLSEYMVPSRYALFEAFPISPHGKLDKQQLLQASLGCYRVPIEHDQTFTAPRTQTETLLHNIWRSVLKADKISVTDSFFDLGGHSLLATRIISRINEQLGVALSLATLFETPSIESLSELIEMEQLEQLTEDELTALISETELSAEPEMKQESDYK